MARVLAMLPLAAVLAAQPNNRPIIGILSMPNDIPGFNGTSTFPASYVKWIEAAGARVVPLIFDAPPDVFAASLTTINGALFTGGGADFTFPNGTLTPFAAAAAVVFSEALSAWATGEAWPLWGTCQGHELISFLASGQNASTLTGGFDSENLTLPLTFTAAAGTSRLYGSLPPAVNTIFATQPVTMNNHEFGVAPSDFAAAPLLSGNFTVLSTNVDRNGKPFVSSLEGRAGLPIWTTQYHPEKPQFEWYSSEVINHSFDSILANHCLALFFVNQTRTNTRAFPTPGAEAAALIYNYPAQYTEAAAPGFEQSYFFNPPQSP